MASVILKKRIIKKVSNVESNDILRRVEKLLNDDRVETLLTPSQQRELEREIAMHKAGKSKSIMWTTFKKKIQKKLSVK